MNVHGAKALFDAAAAALPQRLLDSRGWFVHERTFPILEVAFTETGRAGLRVRFDFSDWNDTPPSATMLTPDGTVLTALPAQRPGPTIFHPGPSPATGRPFICMIGIREYHQHPGHLGDSWSNYKMLDGYAFGAIIDRVWNGWRKFWP